MPVKAEFRNEVKGLIHDSSGSGATVFIEPIGVVEANNEIRVLRSDEKDEIDRILTELSREIGEFADGIIQSYRAAVELNLIFAKGQLAYKMKATVPKLNQEGRIAIKSARHPLIDKNKVVPTDLYLGSDFDALIVTGPNTGGKTVSLKTAGLLTLMTMCGLMIPAADGSEVSIFDHVLADIGDEQSIEQSLSTFSAHMTNIIRILNIADDKSLILIDELGAGTDPVEGAALAISIIEAMRTKGTRVMATTHYAELKAYAIQTVGVENACCEFDVATLRPTYRLLIGVPGRSNAFAISARLGMPANIVEHAKELVSDESTMFEEVVSRLEESRRKMEDERESAEQLRLKAQNMEKEAPLASRLRPTTLEEVVGQQHIIGKDKLLYRAIKADKLSSVIFYGPPGTGKTTLAKVIANTTSAEFTQINATTAGKKDMEEVINKAKEMQGIHRNKTILFVDEIHRFNKGQQDYLLPFVEDGTIILIGATTENPYFEVNGALLSRSSIFELQPLAKEDIKTLITRAVYDTVKGMGSYQAVIDEDALEFLADISGGDARSALNAVELGILTTERSADGKIRITLDVASECIQKRVVKYDKTGDNHYDTISAFIKSMRGSDPDAVYYLAKMLYAGEDIKFIARRIMICASEDVGNADPMALTVAVSASQAVERIGMPEAQIILSQAVTYVATAPKSNAACNAIFDAMASVKRTKTTVPSHLQDAHYKGAQKLGHGIGYKYAHNYPHHYVEQQYLPDEIVGEKFYVPSENGHEKEIKEWMRYIREDQ